MKLKLTGANLLMQEPIGHFDGHAHVFKADLPLAKDRRYTPSYDADIADYIENLQKTDLNGAILVQPSFLGCDNSFLLETLKNAKLDRELIFRGVVVLDPTQTTLDDSYFEEMTDAGVIGIRLNLVKRPDQEVMDLSIWDTLLKKIDKLGWHVEIHCEGARLPAAIKQLLTRCNNIVVDHFGLPNAQDPMNCDSQSAILRGPKGRIFVKASAPYRVFRNQNSKTAAIKCLPIFERLLNELGPEQLLWGSDWPWTQFEIEQSYNQSVAWQHIWLSPKKILDVGA